MLHDLRELDLGGALLSYLSDDRPPPADDGSRGAQGDHRSDHQLALAVAPPRPLLRVGHQSCARDGGVGGVSVLIVKSGHTHHVRVRRQGHGERQYVVRIRVRGFCVGFVLVVDCELCRRILCVVANHISGEI